MELWAIVAGNDIKGMSLVRSNLLKKMKQIRKEIPSWAAKAEIVRLDVISDSEALVNFVVNGLLQEY